LSGLINLQLGSLAAAEEALRKVVTEALATPGRVVRLP
jgi:hypothetical protein